MLRYRLAEYHDHLTLAKMHLLCGKSQAGSFLHRLALSFLNKFYKVTLLQSQSIVEVAENQEKEIVGFIAGTLESADYRKKHKIGLAISAIPAILRSLK